MNEPIKYVVKKKKKRRLKKFLLFLLKTILILIILILLGILVIETLVYLYLKDVKEEVIDKYNFLIAGMNTNYANSKIVDINGDELATLNGDEKRQIITLEDMSPYIPKAYVAIEDERFYEHQGVDIKRTVGAIYTYIKNEGYSGFGGSSITQQLIKNIINDREDSVDRKVREWLLAYELEKNISKDEILEKYLNIIFVGSDVYGVELGSQYYFDKSAKELTLAESAYLAGVTHMPNQYNPFENLNNENLIKTRTKTVLKKMFELGSITQKEYVGAIAEVNNGIQFNEGNKVETIYSYHTDAALNQVIEDFAKENNMSIALAKSYIYSNGLTIYTTQNTEIQNLMEEEFKNPIYILPSNMREGEIAQAAMVVIDHKTGFVLGCVGGLGEKNVSRGLNRATQSTRQTGSAMKPLSVVGPALQEGIITPASIYNDSKATFTLKTGKTYTPKNYNYFRGKITVRQALETSQNVPFVRIMEELTPEKSREYLLKMGISTLTGNDNDLSLAIGGLDKGISPLEMAGGYATIANNGLYIEPTFYTKVVDSKGNVVLQVKQKQEQVYEKSVAYVLKNLLIQPVKGSKGTAPYCAIEGIDVAAKTGTTDYDYDRWLCGFTPYYTASTWYGYDYNETVVYNGTNPAGLIWSNIMNKLHVGIEPAIFEVPEWVETYKICKSSGMLATNRCWSTYEEVLDETHLPDYCTKHSY